MKPLPQFWLCLCLLTLFALFPFLGWTQPTLTQNNHQPQPGDVDIRYQAVINRVPPGPGGANVTWDFSGLQRLGNARIDTFNYMVPPAHAQFYHSAANLAKQYNPDNWFDFYITTPTELQYNGDDAPQAADEETVYEVSTAVLRKYPFTYQQAYVDSFRGTNYGIGAFPFWGYIESEYDGYGTLILPGNTYTNVLRIHMIEYFQESDYQREYWTWYQESIRFPLLEIRVDSGFFGVDTVEVSSSEALPVLSRENPWWGEEVKLYPNPVPFEQQKVNLELFMDQGGEVQLTLLSLFGQVVSHEFRTLSSGRQVLEFPLPGIDAGVYFVELRTDRGVIRQKLVLH